MELSWELSMQLRFGRKTGFLSRAFPVSFCLLSSASRLVSLYNPLPLTLASTHSFWSSCACRTCFVAAGRYNPCLLTYRDLHAVEDCSCSTSTDTTLPRAIISLDASHDVLQRAIPPSVARLGPFLQQLSLTNTYDKLANNPRQAFRNGSIR